jgi:flagellar hook-associated protein 3 FlgL
MRVTGDAFADSWINRLDLLKAHQSRLPNRPATCPPIQSPGNDPVAMGQALNLHAESSRLTQYARTIATLQDRASAISGVLQQLKAVSDRVGEITARAVLATRSAGGLQGCACEVNQLIQQAAQLMNSKLGEQYLFSGTAASREPYSLISDADGNVTGVTCTGAATVAEYEMAGGAALAVDLPGQNNSGFGPRGVTADSRHQADWFGHLIKLRNDLQAGDAGAVAADRKMLMNDENNILFAVATNGAFQVRLEAEAAIMRHRQAALPSSLSTVAGADLMPTLVQLSQTHSACQAALQASANLLQSQQSLLSRLA